MTLDLQGFELDGEGDRTGGTPAAGAETRDPASAALDVLAQAFGVATERGAPGSAPGWTPSTGG